MANFAVLAWLVTAPSLFSRLPVVSAIIWSVLIPYLFLPERFQIELSGLPNIDKTACISFGLILGLIVHRNAFQIAKSKLPIVSVGKAIRIFTIACFFITLFGIFLAALNNQEILRFGPRIRPALRPWDGLALVGEFILLVTPFLFARRYLATPEAHRLLLSALVMMGLCYSILMLVELRLSPQLHRWVFGYHQHSFAQHIRDGYRPMVFLEHGLWVGFFIFMTVISAAGMWRSTRQTRWLWMMLWLLVILALSKNLGALSLGILFLIIFLFTGTSLKVRIAAALAICVLH